MSSTTNAANGAAGGSSAKSSNSSSKTVQHTSSERTTAASDSDDSESDEETVGLTDEEYKFCMESLQDSARLAALPFDHPERVAKRQEFSRSQPDWNSFIAYNRKVNPKWDWEWAQGFKKAPGFFDKR